MESFVTTCLRERAIGFRETLHQSAPSVEIAFPDARKNWKSLNFYLIPTIDYLTGGLG